MTEWLNNNNKEKSGDLGDCSGEKYLKCGTRRWIVGITTDKPNHADK